MAHTLSTTSHCAVDAVLSSKDLTIAPLFLNLSLILIDQVVAKAAHELSINEDEAIVLLKHHDWDSSQLQRKWDGQGAAACKAAAGLTIASVDETDGDELLCKVCYCEETAENMFSCSCKHMFCKFCWESYLESQVGSGADCVSAQCMEQGCIAAVPPTLFNKLLSAERRRNYNNYWSRCARPLPL